MILHHAFVRSAKTFKKKLAIIDRTLGRKVTYGKALIGSLILSTKFAEYDEGYVGIMIPTSAGAFLSILGVLMSGRIPVMINYSTGAAENCEYAQEKCGFKTIVTSRALLEKINCRHVDGMICLEDIMKGISTADKLRAAVQSKLPAASIIRSLPKTEEDDTVVILFTSGSEKEPKAVQLTHRNIGSNIEAAVEVLGITSEDIGGCILPVFHSFGQMCQVWLPLAYGITAVTYANPLDYKTIPQIFREEGVTLTAATPIFLAGYLRESRPGDLETVRLIVAGADKTPDWLRAGYKKMHGLDVLEGYGATETSPVVSLNTPDANRPGSIGKPLPGVQVKIVDLTKGEELPPGEEGKILVKGDLIMKGYLNDLEETSLRIRDGWYDTGDMGVMDEDGYLWHRGRLRRFVKIGGEMISLVRTENVLEKLLPDGVDCCVVELPDKAKGARIAAAVTEPVDDRDIIRKMGDELPTIMIPKQFVVITELPKMGSGKIDFRTVTRMVRERTVNGIP